MKETHGCLFYEEVNGAHVPGSTEGVSNNVCLPVMTFGIVLSDPTKWYCSSIKQGGKMSKYYTQKGKSK